ncbi:MAG: C40 family peptidase [Chloroflexi bacterium]|nr:C40 family peptidase [Chloroflexota bacterium]
MGRSLARTGLGFAASAVTVGLLVATSSTQPGAASVTVPDVTAPRVQAYVSALGAPDQLDPAQVVSRFRDPDARVSITPPAGWVRTPATALDRVSEEDTVEVARFQARLGDPALYAQPLPVTSGLLADATAVVLLSLVRDGSDLLRIDLGGLDPSTVKQLRGADAIDSETSYDGIVTFTRILVSRTTGRSAVIRGYVEIGARDAFSRAVLASIDSAVVESEGPNGARYVAPEPPPPPAPEPAAAPPDPSAGIRSEMIARARSMLGTPYVWGGNVAGLGMDCSSYISRAWGVSRYTTDSIGRVAVAITKDELLPGDAMNLETWRDPAGAGHMRMFDAWANAARTLVWVYEETPPRSVYRVVAYDDRYMPIRLIGLSGGGVAPLIVAPAPKPVATYAPRLATPRPTRTPRPTVTPTHTPTVTPTRTTVTARPSATRTSRPSATATPRRTTPRPSPTPRRTTAP